MTDQENKPKKRRKPRSKDRPQNKAEDKNRSSDKSNKKKTDSKKAQDRDKKQERKPSKEDIAPRRRIEDPKAKKQRKPKSEREKRIDRDVRKVSRDNRLKDTAAREAYLIESLSGKNLESQYKQLEKFYGGRDTIDGQYSAKFSGEQSGIAAGPMGATSTGLRPLSLTYHFKQSIKATDMLGGLRQALAIPPINMAVQKIGAPVLKLALTKLRQERLVQKMEEKQDAKEQKIISALGVKMERVASKLEMQHIRESQFLRKIRELAKRERDRDPNRNPSKFDELNLPFRGI